jgi:hypothetical protein
MLVDLMALALSPDAGRAEANETANRCLTRPHIDGDLDDRIVAFYEALRAEFPDQTPLAPDSPWITAPLDTGIDHVRLLMAWEDRGEHAIDRIFALAARHDITLYDRLAANIRIPDPSPRHCAAGAPGLGMLATEPTVKLHISVEIQINTATIETGYPVGTWNRLTHEQRHQLAHDRLRELIDSHAESDMNVITHGATPL